MEVHHHLTFRTGLDPLMAEITDTQNDGHYKESTCMQEPQEIQIRSLGWEDPLQESMATYSSILAWRIPGMGEPGGLPSMGSHRVGHE